MAKKSTDNRFVNDGMEGIEITKPEEPQQKAEEIDLDAAEEKALDKAWKEVTDGKGKEEA